MSAPARTDGIDAYRRSELHREGPRQSEHACFRGAVRNHLGLRGDRELGPDVDDRAPALATHSQSCFTRDVKRPGEIDGDNGIPFLGPETRKIQGVRDAGSVDNGIEASEPRRSLLDRRGHLRRRGHITLYRDRGGAELVGEFVQGVGAARYKRHPPALGDKPACGRGSDAGRCSGYQRPLAGHSPTRIPHLQRCRHA